MHGYFGNYTLTIGAETTYKSFGLLTERIVNGSLFKKYIKFQEEEKNRRSLAVVVSPPLPNKLLGLQLQLATGTIITISSVLTYNFRDNLIEVKITTTGDDHMSHFHSFYSPQCFISDQVNFNWFEIELGKGNHVITFLPGMDALELKDLLLTYKA